MHTRRDFLRLGSLTAFGLGLPGLLQAATAAPRAKSCILVWLDGGPSHLDLFDPKPDAPREVRGPFGAIDTDIAGVQLSELLPQLAQRLKHVALLRSMTSPLGEHNFGAQYLLTGYKPTPAIEYPTLGAVISHERSAQEVLPAFIAVPDFAVGGRKFSPVGFLPVNHAPLELRGDPANPDFRVQNLTFYPGLNETRLARRQHFLNDLDRFQSNVEHSAQSTATDPLFEQAFRLITSPSAKLAFDLHDETEKTRAAYGPRTIGQSCLLARRLVERGVPLVTVNNIGWDTHGQLVLRLKEGYSGAKIGVGLGPLLDTALAALIDDLREHGLWDSTLLVVMGEFGRTPKLNTGGGRDHWPRVFSVLVGGAGIAGGQVIGRSDAHGESPADRPITPSDLAATIYTLLGIDPRRKLLSPDGRPIAINGDGEVIKELVG